MDAEPSVVSTTESRKESGRVIAEGLRALTEIINYVNQGEQAEPLPPTQSCRMAVL